MRSLHLRRAMNPCPHVSKVVAFNVFDHSTGKRWSDCFLRAWFPFVKSLDVSYEYKAEKKTDQQNRYIKRLSRPLLAFEWIEELVVRFPINLSTFIDILTYLPGIRVVSIVGLDSSHISRTLAPDAPHPEPSIHLRLAETERESIKVLVSSHGRNPSTVVIVDELARVVKKVFRGLNKALSLRRKSPVKSRRIELPSWVEEDFGASVAEALRRRLCSNL